MNLSKTAKYAIRVVSYMALKNQELYSASHLIQALDVSDKYLKRILTVLSNHHIIKSVQGRYGGFRLNKSTENIHLYEIINAVEDIDKYLGCVLGFAECSCETPCSLHHNWMPIRQEFTAFLENTSISEVLKNPEVLKF
ncbi:MAG: transcriptional regulator [Bacteroidia bacterium]|nr:MAG: transcriptional regulator [Bacteroidia bacterium]